MDVVSKQKRSEMMSGIQGKNTKPELMIRKALHGRGFRYRLHVKDLPGKPDIVLPKYKAAVEVNGCFWHRHDCNLFKWPSTREDFWRNKLEGNVQRDIQNQKKLEQFGWRVKVVWECDLKGKGRRPLETVVDELANWILGKGQDR